VGKEEIRQAMQPTFDTMDGLFPGVDYGARDAGRIAVRPSSSPAREG
jgi:hypothetical protein